MRHRCHSILFFVGLAVWAWPFFVSATCPDERDDAVRAIGDASRARGVVSDLELMRAWHADVTRSIDQDYAEHGPPFEDEEGPGYRFSSSWWWWTDSFSGFAICGVDDPLDVDLDRSWWGVYSRVDDHRHDFGYEMFWLTATDGVGLPEPLEDYDYEWRQRIAGATFWYRDWFSARVGTISVEAPSRRGEGLHSGSIHLNLGIPRLGASMDLVTQPGSRRVDTLMLGVRRYRLPWGGVLASATGGWLQDEQKGVFGLGLSGLGDTLEVRAVFEGTPVRLRSVALRTEVMVDRVFPVVGDDVWTRLGAAPFVEVTAFNSAQFEETTGRQLLPGVVTGVRAIYRLATLSTGFEAFVGINRAGELDRLPGVADRLHWGGRFYVRVGI